MRDPRPTPILPSTTRALFGALVALFFSVLASACSANPSKKDAGVIGVSSNDAGANLIAQDLGTGRCYGINADGHVVGVTSGANPGPFVIDPSGARSSLPLYQGDPATTPLAINAAGQIIGSSQTDGGGAIILERGEWSAVPPPSGGEWTAAMDIDESGDIAGVGSPVAKDELTASVLHAYVRRAGQETTDLGIGTQSSAQGISNAKTAIGIYETSAGTTHSFVYDLTRSAFVDLGTLGGANSSPYAINANGDVVGVADTASGAHHAFLYQHGKMQDLGTLGGDRSDARGVDEAGTVVGNSTYTDGSSHPFVVQRGQLLDITPHDASGKPYLMARVQAIQKGRAIGWGLAVDNTTHCVEWSIPE